MTSTLSPPNLHFINPMTNHYNNKRVLLRRSTKQINDPEVIKALSKPKKSVRFAEQERVRYFYKSQSSESVKMDPPFMDISADDYTLSLPNWPSRNAIFYNTEQKIRMENVQLIHGDIQHMKNNQTVLEGRCRALNISFHKIVSIRYSFNLWNTFEETIGEFRESIASTSNTWDRFSFHIPVDASTDIQSVCLALRYTVDDGDYWDNNNGMNYEIIITPPEKEIEQELLVIEEVLEELALPSTMSEIVTKKDSTKVLGRRYDFTASLTAARKPYTSPPPSPPGTPIDTENMSTYTPPVFFNNTQQEQQTHIITPQVKKQVKSPTQPIDIVSQPVTPPDSPPLSAEGFQMSYSDFVNKYCFYNSHSNPIFSTSPSAVLS